MNIYDELEKIKHYEQERLASKMQQEHDHCFRFAEECAPEIFFIDSCGRPDYGDVREVNYDPKNGGITLTLFDGMVLTSDDVMPGYLNEVTTAI